MVDYSPGMSGGTEENHEKLSQNSLSPNRDFNPGPLEFEVRLTGIFFGNQIKEDDVAGTCNSYGEVKNAREIFIGNFQQKRPLR
jgi:hypothetical protein